MFQIFLELGVLFQIFPMLKIDGLIPGKHIVFIEKFCFFILMLSSFESKPVCRCQSTACLFFFLCGCPSEGYYFCNSERPSYYQYLWFLAGKRPLRTRSSSGSLLTKGVSALEFLWETRAFLSCLARPLTSPGCTTFFLF